MMWNFTLLHSLPWLEFVGNERYRGSPGLAWHQWPLLAPRTSLSQLCTPAGESNPGNNWWRAARHEMQLRIFVGCWKIHLVAGGGEVDDVGCFHSGSNFSWHGRLTYHKEVLWLFHRRFDVMSDHIQIAQEQRKFICLVGLILLKCYFGRKWLE